MDEQAVRAALRQYFDSEDPDVAHGIYAPDAVLEFPQSGERFEGLANFKEWRAQYPAKVDYDLRRLRGRDDLWVLELAIRYDGGPWNLGVDILEFRDELVVRESIYVTESWPAPDWRAPWRSAPPREPAGPDASG
jgi:hypothetical protein